MAGLTPKQRRALARARKGKRQPMRRQFARQDMRNQAPQVLAQGVGAVTKRAFGDRVGYSLRCWDAKHPEHLPLPRAVGPYTTVRYTRRISSSDACFVFGTFERSNATDWSNICAYSSTNPALPISAASNSSFYVLNTALGSQATMAPAAISVQIMNPEALQNTKGIIYAGRMHTQAQLGGSGTNWDVVFNRFINYMSPRLCSAGKLALRGIQIDGYPLNMSAVSSFREETISTDVIGTNTWSAGQSEPAGFTPILVYNPQGVELEYLVTVEWRVRFDLENPASSSHVHHPVATDNTWDALMRKAVALGHGAVDIADIVANYGETAVALGRRMLPAGQRIAALMG